MIVVMIVIARVSGIFELCDFAKLNQNHVICEICFFFRVIL